MFKKFLTGIICSAFALSAVPTYANSINGFNIDPETEKMTVSGTLDKADEGALINLWVEDENGKTVIIKQTKSDSAGGYSFEVNLENSLKKGGKFSIFTTSQTEPKAKYIAENGDEFAQFYLSTEIQNVMKSLVLNKDSSDLNKTTIETNRELLEYRVPLLKSSKVTADELSIYIKNSNITEAGAMAFLKSAGEVKTVQNKNADEILALLQTDGSLPDLKSSETFKKLDKKYYKTLAEKLSASNTVYNKESDFISEAEDLTVIAALYNARGSAGVERVIDKYSDKFSLTTLNQAGNDKDEALSLVQKAIESGTIVKVSDVQSIINVYRAESENEQKPGAIKPSTGGGGGGGGTVKNNYTASNNLVSSPSASGDNVASDIISFSDLEDYGWAKDSIEKLVKAGIVNGVSKNEYAPEKTLTRAEFSKMIFKVFGMKNLNLASSFIDVSNDDWFVPYVIALSEKGAVFGTDETHFSPNSEISRQDVCVIIHRLLSAERGEIAKADITYSDAEEIEEYAKEAVAAMTGEALISGEDGAFVPQRAMTRAEAAVLIARVHNYRNGVQK